LESAALIRGRKKGREKIKGVAGRIVVEINLGGSTKEGGAPDSGAYHVGRRGERKRGGALGDRVADLRALRTTNRGLSRSLLMQEEKKKKSCYRVYFQVLHVEEGEVGDDRQPYDLERRKG